MSSVRLFNDEDYRIDCLTRIPLKFYCENLWKTNTEFNYKYFDYTSQDNNTVQYHTHIIDIMSSTIDNAYEQISTIFSRKIIVLIKHLNSYKNEENNYFRFKIVLEERKSAS